MSTTIASARAELLRVRTWPATWVTVSAWLFLAALFGYLFNYLSYRTGDAGFTGEGATRAQLLASVLPPNIPEVLVQGTPMFGGALMMVLGAMVAGNGYGWGTWKTVFTQGPSRTAATLGSLLGLLAVVAGVVLATVLLSSGTSVTLALVESQDITWPTVGALAEGAGVAFLVLTVWAMLGFLLGTLARGPALAVGLGLVWMLVVENLLRGVGGLLGPVEAFTHVLPGTAAGSLVGEIVGAGPDGGGTPGVLDVLSATQATWTLVGYAVLLPVVALVLVRARDVE